MRPTETKKLRDPVHQDVMLTAEEVAVLDTRAVQRQRGVRQLGTAYLVYPGAQHTRFEHGIGTCWMARKIMERLRQSSPGALSAEEERIVALTALIHDVTHVPFGHTIEDERRLFVRHDEDRQRFQFFFERGQLGERLDASGVGEAVRALLAPGDERPGRPCLHQIIAGTVCADLLDYLKRDNYFCGLSHYFDERLFHYFRIVGDTLVMDLHQHGIFRHDALSEITNLLRIRYVLTERVYYHHTKIASGAMISKALERAVGQGFRPRQLYELSDETLIYVLEEHYGSDRGVRFLLDCFRSREIYKRCYTVARDIDLQQQARLVRDFHLNRGGKREEAERAIAQGLGIKDYEVAIYCPPAEMALKEAEVPVLGADGRIQKLAEFNSAEIGVLKEKHRALWRFYVFIAPPHKGRIPEAGRAAEEIIGLPNQLPTQKRGTR